MANPYPIPREARATGVLSGNGAAAYGPFSFKIFDTADVEVIVKPDGADGFSVASVTVAKVSGLALDYFTVTFPAALPATTKFQVRGSRIHERSAGVTAGTKLSADAMEKELSKQAVTLEELRRDVPNIDPDIDDGQTIIKRGDRYAQGPAASLMEAIPGLAAQTEAWRNEAAGFAAQTAADVGVTNANAAQTGLDRAAANTYKTQAYAAMVAAGLGEPVTTLPTPVPADGTTVLYAFSAGMWICEVVGGAWTYVTPVGKVEFASYAELKGFTGSLGPEDTEIHAAGYRHRVAPTSATDEHFTTAGGVKMYRIGDLRQTYYLDSVNGNDAFDGLSETKALATVARLYALVGTRLDNLIIRPARDSTFFGTLGAGVDDNVKVEAYGSGRLPVFDCREVVAPSAMSKTSGYTNVYQFDWTPTAALKVSPSVWRWGDVRLRRASSIAACDSTPGSYYASPSYSAGVAAPVYFHPAASDDPTTGGTEYKQAVRYTGIRLGQKSDVRYVRAGWQQADDGGIILGRHSYTEGIIGQDGTKHNVFVGSGHVKESYAYKGDRDFSVFGGTDGIGFIGYNTANAKDPLWWDNCKVVMEPGDGGNINGGQAAFYNHSQSGQLSFGTVKTTNCESYYVDSFFGCAETVSADISDCFTYNTARFFRNTLNLQDNAIDVHRCEYVLDAPGGASYYGFVRPVNGGASVTYNIEDCITLLAGDAAGLNNTAPFNFLVSGGSETLNLLRTLLIIDRDIAGSATGFNLPAVSSSGGRTFNIDHCLLDGFGYGSQGRALQLTTSDALNADWNVYIERQSDNSTSPRLRFYTPDIAPGYHSTASDYLAAISGTADDEPNSIATVQWQFDGDPCLRQYDLLQQFDRNTNTIRTDGEDFVTNGDFTSGVDGWSNDGTSTIAHDATNGRIDVDRNGSSINAGNTTARIPISGLIVNRVYKLSADVAAASHSASVSLYNSALDTQYTTAASASPAGTTLSVVFRATVTDGYVGLGCTGNTNATASFDNVILEEVGTGARINDCIPRMTPKYRGRSGQEVYDELVSWLESA